MRRLFVFAGLLFAAAHNDARGCNVPAFRYALEMWPADPYQVLVYHESEARGQAVELLQRRGVNLALRHIDVTRPEGKAFAQRRGIASYPWVEVFYPEHLQPGAPLWSGPLTVEAARRIVESPARSALAKGLLAGDVAVWVLLNSGDEMQDGRALETLRANLERASATLRMPEIGTDLNGNPVEVKDFKTHPVHFALLQVGRNDVREQLFVSSLLQSEPDLAQHREPMAFPVFGRGRALYALVGAGIQDKTIMEACQSLLAWCSCEIKAQNPGTDLLIAADWSRPYGGKMVVSPEVPPLTGVAAFREAPKRAEAFAAKNVSAPAPARVACPIAPAPAAAPSPKRDPVVRNVLYLAGAAGLALVGLTLYVKKIGTG